VDSEVSLKVFGEVSCYTYVFALFPSISALDCVCVCELDDLEKEEGRRWV